MLDCIAVEDGFAEKLCWLDQFCMPDYVRPMTTRIDVAFAKLREAILEQVLLPGIKLPEDIIGSHFGISRTLARAALVRLSAEGLVAQRIDRISARPHRGQCGLRGAAALAG